MENVKKTKEEVLTRIRQSIAKKNSWLKSSDAELQRIYAERHGSSAVVAG